MKTELILNYYHCQSLLSSGSDNDLYICGKQFIIKISYNNQVLLIMPHESGPKVPLTMQRYNPDISKKSGHTNLI